MPISLPLFFAVGEIIRTSISTLNYRNTFCFVLNIILPRYLYIHYGSIFNSSLRAIFMFLERVLFTVYLALSSLPLIAGQPGALQAPLSSQPFITTTSTIQGALLAGNGVPLQQFTSSSSAGPDSTSIATTDQLIQLSTAAVTSNGMLR